MGVLMSERQPPGETAFAARCAVVLDTNIVLDLLVFDDPATHVLRQALDAGTVVWIAVSAMRTELERVLNYADIFARVQARGQTCAGVLARFDQLSMRVDEPPTATIHCSDADDQVFIDLAVAHRACLLSKDLAVVSLYKQLARVGVQVSAALGLVHGVA